jgi:hypothetical protein
MGEDCRNEMSSFLRNSKLRSEANPAVGSSKEDGRLDHVSRETMLNLPAFLQSLLRTKGKLDYRAWLPLSTLKESGQQRPNNFGNSGNTRSKDLKIRYILCIFSFYVSIADAAWRTASRECRMQDEFKPLGHNVRISSTLACA